MGYDGRMVVSARSATGWSAEPEPHADLRGVQDPCVSPPARDAHEREPGRFSPRLGQVQTKETSMQIVHPRGCGRAVHTKRVVACVLITAATGAVQREIRTSATRTAELLLLRDGRESVASRALARESTGVCWHPRSTILEDDAWTIMLGSAQQSKAVRGTQNRWARCGMAGRSLPSWTAQSQLSAPGAASGTARGAAVP
jgi:hypothetical protein